MDNEKYNELLDKWSGLVENLILNDESIEVVTLKQMIFDTYCFCRKKLYNKTSICRENLTLYKFIVQAATCLSKEYAQDMTEAESLTCLDCLEGLIYVIENGFNAGYGKYPLPLGLSRHTPAGGADPEADMTSFDSFDNSFEDNVKLLREDYDYE